MSDNILEEMLFCEDKTIYETEENLNNFCNWCVRCILGGIGLSLIVHSIIGYAVTGIAIALSIVAILLSLVLVVFDPFKVYKKGFRYNAWPILANIAVLAINVLALIWLNLAKRFYYESTVIMPLPVDLARAIIGPLA